jgi:AcrR family transcriptional regulator
LPAATRERLLEAAFRALSRKGYENTTVKDIAEEAGVAQGLVHYYFKSKQALVLAVLVMCCAEMELPGSGGDPARHALDAFEHFKAMLREHRDVHGLYVELIGVGLHDQEIGGGVREFMRQDRGTVEDIAREILAQRELPSRGASALAGAVYGGCLGIMLQHLVDPEFDAEAAVDALAVMSLAAAAHQPE